MEALIPIALFVSIVFIVKFVVDARLRRRLAETHANDELIRAMLVADEQSSRASALKWGIVLMMVGAAFGLIELWNLRPSDAGTWGLLSASAGLGLLLYRFAPSRGS